MTGTDWRGFGMDVEFDGPEVVVSVRGEVDLLTASTMGALLDALVGQGHQHVTVDLSRLAFMDAAGLEVIVDIAGRLARSEGALVVRSAPALTRRIIQIAGVADRLMLTPPAAPPSSSNAQGLHGDLASVRSRRADTEVLDAALRLVAVLTRATVEGADGVSVTLPRRGHLMTVASTDETIRRMDGHQYETGQGPCLSAAEEGRPFHAASLDDEARWPAFVPRARQEGIASILSTPLTADGAPLGALNIYSNTGDVFGPHQQELASLFAHQASELMTDTREQVTDEQLATRIRDGLVAREVIAQAQGVYMARHGMSPVSAAAALHRAARAGGVTVAVSAAAIVRSTQATSRSPAPSSDYV
ncbi:hypothetical protein BH23ACT9_BH23ACT9_06370 [soil metagenome]